ncbi:MAG: hypothetical protein L0956_01410 [Candidatus Mariimomonas ferrooxydans]
MLLRLVRNPSDLFGIARKILEASLRVESLRPDKPACRQASGNDIERSLTYELISKNIDFSPGHYLLATIY